ncbi:hypothetical protein IJM86_02885 [bacterium]|nr:hypothetical protein [bacterium]
MYQKILEEMVKTPKFEDIVNTKIEQAIALHKIDNPNDKNREPTTDEKTKIITDTFDELTTGKDKNSKEYIGIQIEKIGYLCKNDENLDISNLLTNEFEEIKNIKDNLIKINETNNNFDEIQQKLTKIKTIRTILIEKGL